MIHFEQATLANGLQVFFHQDKTTPIAAVNILYNVGSRDESPDRTGFAHFFEHLMFTGSVNIPEYDEVLQRVGGENNAFTSPDVTNYYITLPVTNLETAFWLESDRMLGLAFHEKKFEAQRGVVIEEFKQRYLNQPYGDIWLKLRPLAYQVHPYHWNTIGKEIAHIEEATLEEVKAFFKKHYVPNNAILVVAGNTTWEEVQKLAEKWFAPIPAGEPNERNLPQEPIQKEARVLETTAKVPLSAIYKAYHMVGKGQEGYFATDLLSDILGRGKSSRLYEQWVREKPLFNQIGSHVSASFDPGLLVIYGTLNENVSMQEAEDAIQSTLTEICHNLVSETELSKVKNKAEASIAFEEVDLLGRAKSIAFGAVIGNPNYLNEEKTNIQAITAEQIHQMAQQVLKPENCATLHYHKENA